MYSESSVLRSAASVARRRTSPIHQTYHELIRKGFDSVEAANLVAHLSGIRVGESSWTLGEVTRLRFLRHLYRSGRFDEANEVRDLRAA